MKVLFVASGNKKVGQVNSFVQSQYDSLKSEGVDMRLFPVKGHGIKAYLRASWNLRQLIRKERPDVLHAHYSLCGWSAVLACMGLRKRPKIVVSILGSFPKPNTKLRLVRFSIRHLWNITIVKSQRTANQLALPVAVIPNGVNLEIFHPINKNEARKKVGFETNDQSPLSSHKYIIWCSNPTNRPEKNWPLAEAAAKQLQITNAQLQITLVPVFDKTPDEVMTYMNAADCLLLTSDSEGSPNVIKEAMACNCPIVTTDVGDVRERLVNLEGCYIVRDNDCRFTDTKHAAELIATELQKALAFSKRTAGYQRILDDKLEISQIAKRILDVYEQI